MSRQALTRVDISPLVTTKWLAGILFNKPPAPLIRVLDGSLLHKIPGGAEDAFKKRHIPGALFFDVDECRDTNSRFPRMLPKTSVFEDYVGNLGISNNTHVVVYDISNSGLFSAPRVWWMLRYFGHDSVSVLNGGLPKWLAEGLEVTKIHNPVTKEIFKAQPNPRLLKVYEDIEALAKENFKSLPFVDVRRPSRFTSHMKGAINIPRQLLSNDEEHTILSPNELKENFKKNGVDIDKPFVSSCNSGITACAGALAAFLCGNEDVPVYDGSWQEWHQRAPPELTVFDQSSCHDLREN